MKSKDVEKVLEMMHHLRPDELGRDARKLFSAIMQIADYRDEYQAHNIELLSFIRDYRLEKEYRNWKRGKYNTDVREDK